MFFDIVGEVNDGRNLTNDFLLSFYIWKVNKAGFYSRLNELEWTTMDLNGQIGNFVGISWEKLGTFSNGFQAVTKIFGNFVGITWE
jgi:hypothetical protein